MAHGRVARRLAELLKAEGYTVVAFYPALGAYRSDWRQDCYRWSAAVKTAEGFERMVDSWDTMTACVKAGAVDVDTGEWEVFAVNRLTKGGA